MIFTSIFQDSAVVMFFINSKDIFHTVFKDVFLLNKKKIKSMDPHGAVRTGVEKYIVQTDDNGQSSR